MTISIDVLRVFTNANDGLGNTLGIVESSAASRGREQAIAAELAFRETAFVDDIDGPVARARVFTPVAELGFAGPVVGLAWWLRGRGHAVQTLDLPVGSVPVTVEAGLTFVSMRPEWCPPFEYVELASPSAVDALDPDAAPDRATYFWAWSEESGGRVRARMLGRDLGTPEIHATGTAAAALSTRLRRDLEIVQGAGCRLVTRWLGERTAIGGRVVQDRVAEFG